MVGRPREFDEEQVLDAAMQAFWSKGYEATSLGDLMAATGLHKGSLYQAFGDKHALFLQVLARYLAEMRRHKNECMAKAATPLEGIKAVAHSMVDMADADPICPKGCMAINSLVELAPHDTDVERMMTEHVANMRESLEGAISAAQDVGEIGKERPASVTAAMMMTFMAGLATTMKGQIDKDTAHQLLDSQFEVLV
jgi:TetR/AcrR family transcriptional repressor of nem operon